MGASLSQQLLEAAKSFDLARVTQLVHRGARNENAFLSDLGGTLISDDPNAALVFQFLREQGREASTEKEALFELYETLLLAGHEPPDGSSRRCAVRVIYGADPTRFDRARKLATLCEEDHMLNWETSAWAHQIRLDREADGRSSFSFLEPLSIPHGLFMDAMAAAAEQGNEGLLKHLIGQPPNDPKAAYDWLRGGTSPLFKALTGGHIPCVQLLLGVMDEPRWRAKGFHSTDPVSAVSIASAHGQRAVVDWLFEQGIGQDEPYPGTVIANAIKGKKFKAALDLVARGWDVNAVKPGEPTPLHMTVWEKAPHLIGPLLDAGHDVDPRDAGGFTPLAKAGMVGVAEAIAPLVAAGADVEAADKEGRTAMHWACRNDRTETFEALRRAGARLDVPDKEGFTAAEQAKGEVRARIQQEILEGAIPSSSPRSAPRF